MTFTQGKDRKEQLEKDKSKKEKNGEDFNFNCRRKVKTELKLHVMYEGHKIDNNKRHEVVNKSYIAGIMKPKRLSKIRDARVHQKYNVSKLKLRVMNEDGAQWINASATKDTITQKDQFHISQEIERKIKDEEQKKKIYKMLENKEYSDIPIYIEELKYKTTGEEKEVKKLEVLKKYLSTGLERVYRYLKKRRKRAS